MMNKMPTFSWEAPNIHAKPGAIWLHRDSWVDDPPHPRTDVPKGLICSVQGDHGRTRISEYRPPANVGGKFYATLKRLGYTKDPDGEYR